MKKDRKTQKYGWLVLTGLMLVCLMGCAQPQMQFVERSQVSSQVEISSQVLPEVASEEKKPETLYVHVCGAVKEAGIYRFPVDARVFEAIEAAGGLTQEAAAESVNQARLLTDGEELYIPTKEEVLSASAVPGAETPVSAGESTEDDRININTADVDTLTGLNGIGKAKAEAIIAWREENGGFSSVEEIKNIDGIADKTYEKLKDRITVN